MGEGVDLSAGLGHSDAGAPLPHCWQTPRGAGFSLTNACCPRPTALQGVNICKTTTG